MTVLDVLRAARKRIDSPEKWCQDSYGWDGRSCLEAAVKRCDPDAIFYAPSPPVNAAIWALMKDCGQTVPLFNDSHTHAEVLALLDRVIAKLEEQEYGEKLPPLTTTLHPSERSRVPA